MADQDQTSGLLKPLVGKDAVHIKCQRCGEQGHTDRECPLYLQGNRMIETFRYMHEDPMHDYFEQRKIKSKEERINELQAILDAPTSSESDSDSSSNNRDKKRKKKRKHKSSHSEHKSKKRKADTGERHRKKKSKDKQISEKRKKSKHKKGKSS